MDSKEKENINEEELKAQDAQDETCEETTEKEEEVALTEEEKLTQELQKANAEIEDQKDKYLRLSAEFDNYRKRILKEKSELILNGGEKVISSLLPVLDDFERALINIKKGGDETTLLQGTELIYQKLLSTLESQGLSKIKTEKEDFNTDFHEAVAMVPVDDESMKGKVVDCVQTGYTLNNKVIRHSKVAVGQ